MRILVAGYSTRAIAESAARAGFDVVALDAFADLDQHPSVTALNVEPPKVKPGLPFTTSEKVKPRLSFPELLAKTSLPRACDAVAYLSPFENHPDAVRTLACGRELWGNPADVLRAVRDPWRVAAAFERHGLPVPRLRAADLDTPDLKIRPTTDEGEPERKIQPTTSDPKVGGRLFRSAGHSAAHARDAWLLKPLASGGGNSISRWEPGAHVPHGHYVQQSIDGQPGSVTFVAAHGRARVIGISRQLVGRPEFGASGFRYCGSILDGSCAPPPRTMGVANALAAAAAAEFGLTGVNGVDFIARDQSLYPIEVNPRWTASMELVELAHGISVFGAHADACRSGTLPTFDATAAEPIGRTIGKAVVFARHNAVAGDTHAWCSSGFIRDVPRPGTIIQAGDPVCTVFADAASVGECQRMLEGRAADVFSILLAWSVDPS